LLWRGRLLRPGVWGSPSEHEKPLLDACDDGGKVLRGLLETLGQRHFLRVHRRRYNSVLDVLNLLPER